MPDLKTHISFAQHVYNGRVLSDIGNCLCEGTCLDRAETMIACSRPYVLTSERGSITRHSYIVTHGAIIFNIQPFTLSLPIVFAKTFKWFSRAPRFVFVSLFVRYALLRKIADVLKKIYLCLAIPLANGAVVCRDSLATTPPCCVCVSH